MRAGLAAALPRDWATPPVYARFSVHLGKMLDEKQITGAHLAPYLRNVDVQWSHVNTVDLPEMNFCDEDRQQYSLRTGDLLVCEGGEVGRTAIWGGAVAEGYFQPFIAFAQLLKTMSRAFSDTHADGGGKRSVRADDCEHHPAPNGREVTSCAVPGSAD